jgi:hypothetical protein
MARSRAPTHEAMFMEGKDWAIVFATLCGPILAVQAQKWIEGLREYRQRKMWVFTTLMATRGARLHADHVRALNMIEMAFFGRRAFAMRFQRKTERAVCNAWQAYLSDLSLDSAQLNVPRRNGLFVDLLVSIATDVGFDFDRNHITQSVYSPMAHGEAESEQTMLRKAMLEVVSGRLALKMNIERFPFVQDAVDAQIDLQQKLAAALADGVLAVEVRNGSED